MRRYWREQRPPSMFRGAELMRLVAGIFMLVLICMLMVRFRDPGTWRWLVGDERTAGAIGADRPRRKRRRRPALARGHRSDRRGSRSGRRGAQKSSRRSPTAPCKFGPEEMEPYDRLVEWVKNQSFARLYRRATKGLRYTNLYDDADKHRGELVALDWKSALAERRRQEPLRRPAVRSLGGDGRVARPLVLADRGGLPQGDAGGRSASARRRSLPATSSSCRDTSRPAAKPGQAPEKAPLVDRPAGMGAAGGGGPADRQPAGVDLGARFAGGDRLGVGAALGLSQVDSPKAAGPIGDAGSAGGEVIPIEAWLERSSFNAKRPERSRRATKTIPATETASPDDPHRT